MSTKKILKLPKTGKEIFMFCWAIHVNPINRKWICTQPCAAKGVIVDFLKCCHCFWRGRGVFNSEHG